MDKPINEVVEIPIENKITVSDLANTKSVRCCQYEVKQCNQRCHKSYRYCFRHILNDKEAPFKQCQYIIHKNKSKSQQCATAIDMDNEKNYCKKHMCALGLVEKKSNKKVVSNNKTNIGESIPKQLILKYSPKNNLTHMVKQFIRDSIANDYRYEDNSIELLYYRTFNSTNLNNNVAKTYESILSQSLHNFYRKNLKLFKHLNLMTKIATKVIKKTKECDHNTNVSVVYNTAPSLLYEHRPIQCSAKIISNDSHSHNQCANKAIVGLNYCIKHIKLNKKQVIFTSCTFKNTQTNEICRMPVVGKKLTKSRNRYCSKHRKIVLPNKKSKNMISTAYYHPILVKNEKKDLNCSKKNELIKQCVNDSISYHKVPQPSSKSQSAIDHVILPASTVHFKNINSTNISTVSSVIPKNIAPKFSNYPENINNKMFTTDISVSDRRSLNQTPNKSFTITDNTPATTNKVLANPACKNYLQNYPSSLNNQILSNSNNSLRHPHFLPNIPTLMNTNNNSDSSIPRTTCFQNNFVPMYGGNFTPERPPTTNILHNINRNQTNHHLFSNYNSLTNILPVVNPINSNANFFSSSDKIDELRNDNKNAHSRHIGIPFSQNPNDHTNISYSNGPKNGFYPS